MEKPLKPFHTDGDARQVGDLKIESQTDRIEMYGSLSIKRDKSGLAVALQLKQVIDAAVDLLKSEKLPEKLEDVPSKTVANPFASK